MIQYIKTQVAYLMGSLLMFIAMLVIGGIVHEPLAGLLGMSPAVIVVAFVLAWLLASRQLNAYLTQG